MNDRHKEPSLGMSLIPLLIITLFMGVGYGILHIQAESLLIASAGLTGLLAAGMGYSWKELEAGIVRNISKALPAMLIILVVGALISSWMSSGTIPMLIYYGLKIITPKYFLVTACIVSSLVSLFTGSSWGSIGTIGVAFMGVAQGMGIPDGPAAGAIIAGAFFGDKLSPFSDTTNLAAISTRCNIFDHIRHTLWTTVPCWLIGLVIYFFYGMRFRQGVLDSSKMNLLMDTLSSNFNFHILLLLPLLITLYFAIRKKPTIPGMLLSVAAAVVLSVLIQGRSLPANLAGITIGYQSEIGVGLVDQLISRGGLRGMLDVILFAVCAFSFAGIIRRAGMLEVILRGLLKIARTPGRLIASAVGSSFIVGTITGSSFLAIIIPGELYSPAFKKMNLAAKNLSRITEDSGTVVAPLIPWSTAGVFVAGTLGVPTLTYLPFAFMCYLGMAFALFYGCTGFAVAKRVREDETIPGS